MTTNILPAPRKLRLNTFSVPPRPLHPRSQTPLYTPSVRHHPGKRIASIIPCTCSGPSILTQPGKPCLVEILSPSPASPFRRSKRYGLVSPMSSHSNSNSSSSNNRSRSTSSASLSLAESLEEDGEEEAVEIEDARAFQDYLPRFRFHDMERCIGAAWAAWEMWDANERGEMAEMRLGGFALPFVNEGDFNYYPSGSPRPLSAVITEESLTLGDTLLGVGSWERGCRRWGGRSWMSRRGGNLGLRRWWACLRRCWVVSGT
ncbi:hypothetical protein PMIN04_006232 [Paraphaeosphaeria minitans]